MTYGDGLWVGNEAIDGSHVKIAEVDEPRMGSLELSMTLERGFRELEGGESRTWQTCVVQVVVRCEIRPTPPNGRFCFRGNVYCSHPTAKAIFSYFTLLAAIDPTKAKARAKAKAGQRRHTGKGKTSADTTRLLPFPAASLSC